MSAFICNTTTFDALVLFCVRHKVTRLYRPGKAGREMTPTQIGQLLLDENVRSVNARYKEDTFPDAYAAPGKGDPVIGTLRTVDPVQALKLCGCVDYQSCETDDWHTTDAYWMLNTIRDEAIRALPGYNEANWDMPE